MFAVLTDFKSITFYRLTLLSVCLLSLLGCQTLKEQYKSRSSEIQEYCKSVLKDAGYKKTISKKIMSECIFQTDN